MEKVNKSSNQIDSNDSCWFFLVNQVLANVFWNVEFIDE